MGRRITTSRSVFDPTITVIGPEPANRTGASIVILPGGGFGGLARNAEGIEVGQFLARLGITAFVLNTGCRTPPLWRLVPYLVGNVKAGTDPAISAATADAEQVMRVIRDNAVSYRIDTNRVGMMSFAAGPITLLRVLQATSDDMRPDFAASIYGFHWEDGALPKSTPCSLQCRREPSRGVGRVRRREPRHHHDVRGGEWIAAPHLRRRCAERACGGRSRASKSTRRLAIWSRPSSAEQQRSTPSASVSSKQPRKFRPTRRPSSSRSARTIIRCRWNALDPSSNAPPTPASTSPR